MEMTIEQKRAIALASARARAAEAEASPQEPKGGALQTLKDATQGVTQGITGNWSDELFSYGMAPFGMVKGAITGDDAGKSFTQRFHDNQQSALAFNRKTQKEAATNSPIANTAGQITGAVMTAGNLAKGGATLLNVANPTVANLTARGAIEGALYGGIYGAGEGEGFDDKVGKGLWGAGIGGVTGGVTGAVTGKLAQNAAAKSIPTADALEAQAKAAYRAAENAGVKFHPIDQTIDKLTADATKLGLDKTLTPNSVAAISRLEELRGVPATLEALELKRRIINNAVKTAARAGNDADVAILNSLRTGLDDFVNSVGPQQFAGSISNPQTAISQLNEARKLWAMQAKSNQVTDALERAANRTSVVGSGGNQDNATRQEILKILKNPRGFSQAEQDAMQRVVDGTKTQNALRLLGKVSPEGNGLSLLLNLGAAGATSGASLPLTALGAGAKFAADRATQSNVRVLDALIRSGGNLPKTQALSPAQKMIIDSLLANQNTISNQVRQQLPVR